MKKSLFTLAGTVLLLCGSMFAEDAASIIDKSVNLPRPDYSQTIIKIELTDKAGAKELRTVNQFGNNKQNQTQTVFDFREPASVKDTRLLQQEKSNGQDTKYIYLPSLRTTRQIATADRKKDFVGTDFSYNDMTLRKAENDEHTFVNENATKAVSGKNYQVWVIKSVPVANKNVEYSYRIQYVDKASYIPVVTEFYDKTDKLLKVLTVEDLQKIQGSTGKSYWLRKTQLMENKVNGHKTKLTIEKMLFDKPVSDNYFTQNWLNTGK